MGKIYTDESVAKYRELKKDISKDLTFLRKEVDLTSRYVSQVRRENDVIESRVIEKAKKAGVDLKHYPKVSEEL